MAPSAARWRGQLGGNLRAAMRAWEVENLGVSTKLGVLFWGPYMRDPIILGPYWVTLIFSNSHIKNDSVDCCDRSHNWAGPENC